MSGCRCGWFSGLRGSFPLPVSSHRSWRCSAGETLQACPCVEVAYSGAGSREQGIRTIHVITEKRVEGLETVTLAAGPPLDSHSAVNADGIVTSSCGSSARHGW